MTLSKEHKNIFLYVLKNLKKEDSELTGIIQDILSEQDKAQVEAFQKLDNIAKQNPKNHNALFLLGYCFEVGVGVTKDDNLALDYTQKSAIAGNGSAQNHLGLMYHRGVGLDKNQKLALEFFRKAADQEHSMAQYHLGLLFLNGWGVEKNTKMAIEWLEKSAAQGNDSAQCCLGLIYHEGLGIEKNPEIAEEWFKKSAAERNTIAKFMLREEYGWLTSQPALWQAAYCKEWDIFSSLLETTVENIFFYQNIIHRYEHNHRTALGFVSKYSQWDRFGEKLLEILKRNPVGIKSNFEDRWDIDVQAVIDNVFEDALNKGDSNSVLHLLNIGVFIGEYFNFYNSMPRGKESAYWRGELTSPEQLKALSYLNAAKEIFSLIEGKKNDRGYGFSDRTPSVETKEDIEERNIKLKAAIKILGSALNGRKNRMHGGQTALEFAIEKGNQHFIETLVMSGAELPKAESSVKKGNPYLTEALVMSGAELPKAKSSDFPIIAVYKKVADIKKSAELFDLSLHAYEVEKKSTKVNKESIEYYEQRLSLLVKNLVELGEEFLKLVDGLKESHQSQLCYEIGTLFHSLQPYFKEMAYKVLQRVTQDKDKLEKVNSILFHYELDEKMQEESSAESTNSLSFAIKAGNQLPPQVLAYHLSTKILGKHSDIGKPIGLTGEKLTRNDVLIALLREYQKLNPAKKDLAEIKQAVESKQAAETTPKIQEIASSKYTKLDHNTSSTFLEILKIITGRDLGLKNIIEDILTGQDKLQSEAVAKLELMVNSDSKPKEAAFVLGYCYRYGFGTAKDYDKARKCVEMTQHECSFALWGVGRSYALGQGVAGDLKLAHECYQRSAALGNVFAYYNLAVAYLRGDGVEQDDKIALEWFKKSANQGFSGAQNYIGWMYDLGRGGLEKNNRSAFEWYQKAALQGNPTGQCNLGLMYENARGVEKDCKTAREWFEKSALQNYADALYNLGRMYEDGIGVERDYKIAHEWYEKAAAQNHAAAMNNLGRMHEAGHGVEKNTKIAREWYEKAIARDHAMAKFNLGQMYENGVGVEQDYKMAREWYEKAAAQNHAAAMNNLGYIYEKGRGVEKDPKISREWYEKAIALDHAMAKCNLGRMYEDKIGVEQDYKMAREWYEKAALQGVAAAMVYLGNLFRDSKGIEKNDKVACEWYRKAISKGNIAAMTNLGWMYENGCGVERDYKIACEWYEKAALQGGMWGQCYLGIMYANGKGVGKNNSLAYKWLSKSVAQENDKALFSLGYKYLEGLGLEQNKTLVYEYLKKLAEEKDYYAAKYALELIFDEGKLEKDKVLDKQYSHLPLLWQAAFHHDWWLVSFLLNISNENIAVFPTSGPKSNSTLLWLASNTYGQWDKVERLLDILKSYPINGRNLDVKGLSYDGTTEGETTLSRAIDSDKYEVIVSLLNLGASIDKHKPSSESSYSYRRREPDPKIPVLLQAAKDLFTIVEGRSTESKRLVEIKETSEKTHSRLKEVLKVLGNAVNGRKNGATVLDVALEKGVDPKIIEALVAHGAEATQARVKDVAIIKAFAAIADVKKEVEMFEVTIHEQEYDKRESKENKEIVEHCKLQLEKISQKIATLSNEVLELANDINEPWSSQVCYELGALFPVAHPQCKDLINKALLRVTQDEMCVAKANAILFNLNFQTNVQSQTPVVMQGLEGTEEDLDILSFVIKAGDQISPSVLADYLFTHVFGLKFGVGKTFGLTEDNLSRDNVLIAVLGECQKRVIKEKPALEKKEKADISAVKKLEETDVGAIVPMLVAFLQAPTASVRGLEGSGEDNKQQKESIQLIQRVTLS